MVQGHPVVFQQPTDPFTYLGVVLTMTLKWKHQFHTATENLKQLAKSLYHTKATAGQQMKIINTKIRPAITYAFCVAPYTPMELRLLDSRLTQMTKRAYKQRHASPTAMVHEDPTNFGMGCTSLLVDYTHACIKQLTSALNDTTRYGEVSRAILTHQLKLTGGMIETEIITASRSMMRIRQASALQQSNLVLHNRTTGQDVDLEANTLVQNMRQIFNCGHSNPTDQPTIPPHPYPTNIPGSEYHHRPDIIRWD
jgi:hypothetical protein